MRKRILATIALLLALGAGTVFLADESIPDAAGSARPIRPGVVIPALTLRDSAGHDFDLGAALREKPAVIIVYRGGWCPYCSAHLGKLKTVENDLLALGLQILAVSPDRPEKLLETGKKLDSPGTRLLSDSDIKLARALGLAFRVDAATREKYRGYGIDLQKASGKDHGVLPVPAVIVTARGGRVRFVHADPDYTRRLEPGKVLAAARSVLRGGEEVAAMKKSELPASDAEWRKRLTPEQFRVLRGKGTE
ncbi:MAG: peroxiredoxin-like family protein, partial [Planctomycetota bacterium]